MQGGNTVFSARGKAKVTDEARLQVGKQKDVIARTVEAGKLLGKMVKDGYDRSEVAEKVYLLSLRGLKRAHGNFLIPNEKPSRIFERAS